MPKKEVVTYTRKLDIPEEKIAEYKEAFDMFDKNKKGTISASDITKIMKNFGYPISRKEVEAMIAEMDTSGNGELDFEEFVTFMQKQTQIIEESDEDQVLKAFKSFDKDHDGKITMYEFRYILSQLGDMFTDEECDTLFKECDLDNEVIQMIVEYYDSKLKCPTQRILRRKSIHYFTSLRHAAFTFPYDRRNRFRHPVEVLGY